MKIARAYARDFGGAMFHAEIGSPGFEARRSAAPARWSYGRVWCDIAPGAHIHNEWTSRARRKRRGRISEDVLAIYVRHTVGARRPQPATWTDSTKTPYTSVEHIADCCPTRGRTIALDFERELMTVWTLWDSVQARVSAMQHAPR